MELKAGYKQTDVGVIPEDWTVETLGKLGQAIIGLTYKPEQVADHGTLVLRSSNIQNCALTLDDNVYVLADIPAELMVQEGDVLICVRNGSRDLIGKTALLDKRANGMTFGAFMAILRSPLGNLIHYHFQSSVLKRQISAHLGATINQITNKSLRSFQLILPPTKGERDSIVEVLQDVDDLIEHTNSLIDKKKEIKQAAMQELLAGKRRLPGFEGEWEVKTLFDLANRKKEFFDDGDWIESEHITTKGIRLIQTGNIGIGAFAEKADKKFINEASFTSLRCKQLTQGDLLICRLADPAGRSCVLPDIGEERIVTSVDVTIFRPAADLADRHYLRVC